MKKCIAIILLISMTFSCRTDIVNGLENTKDLENKTNWKIPKTDVDNFLYILGTLGFAGLSIYLHHKFSTKKIDSEPELSNESTSIDSSINVDSSEPETVQIAGSPSEPTQEPVPDTNYINHIESANESVVSNARDARVKNSSSKENKNIDQHVLSEPTQEDLKYKKLYWQWLLCVYQIEMFFDKSIDISVLKNMFANCIAIIFDFENNKKIVCKSTDKININNCHDVILDIIIEIKYSTETNLDAYRNMCIRKLKPILMGYFGLQSDNQVYRNEEQINHMIKFVEHNTAHEYLAKCEGLQDPLKFKRSQDSEPEYIKTGKLVQYNFSPPVY